MLSGMVQNRLRWIGSKVDRFDRCQTNCFRSRRNRRAPGRPVVVEGEKLKQREYRVEARYNSVNFRTFVGGVKGLVCLDR